MQNDTQYKQVKTVTMCISWTTCKIMLFHIGMLVLTHNAMPSTKLWSYDRYRLIYNCSRCVVLAPYKLATSKYFDEIRHSFVLMIFD